MNEHDLLDAIGTAEESMLEASEKRPLLLRKPLLTAAACLLLILSTVPIFFNQPSPSRPSTPTTLPEQNISSELPGQTISTETITWLKVSNIYAVDSTMDGMMPAEYSPEHQFAFQMSVEARVLDVLPDQYQGPYAHTYSQPYRILRMELLDPIFAPNMPSEFYYLIPDHLSVGISEFDSLIITVAQIGCENSLQLNLTQRRMESFSFLFSSGYYNPHNGAVIACKDGKTDVSLWQLEGWREWEKWPEALTDPERATDYPGKSNRSIPEIKNAIKRAVAEYQAKELFSNQDVVLSNNDLDWPEAQAMLDQVTPFAYGCYHAVEAIPRRSVTYIRLINGFATNEIISIHLDSKETTTQNVFTDADLEKLPDLGIHISSADRLTPPDPWSGETDPYLFCGASGRYEKHGEHIFGIITINWGYPDTKESERGADCIIRKIKTHSYLLVYPNGETAETEDYDTLQELIAEYTG